MTQIGHQRKQSGQGHSVEFGLALVVIFVIIVFPFIDFLFYSFTYGAGYILNHTQLRQAALTKNTEVKAEMDQITADWAATGLGQHVSKGQAPPTTEVTYKATGIGTDVEVTVTTTVTANSLIPIPFLSSIPGFGAPMQFVYSGQRLLENSTDYTPPAPVK